jgi:hypothetical protein
MVLFTAADFLDLLERARRWCKLLLTAMFICSELRTMEALSIADDLVSHALEWRARALRN